MQWKIVRIYKAELDAETPYRAMKAFLELEEKGEVEPSQEFATQDKPDGFLRTIKKQLGGR